MSLSRSSFYYKPETKRPERMRAEADLMDRIEAICLVLKVLNHVS